MAKAGAVRLSGRFKPGTEVRLIKVADERALRSEGGEEVGTATVDKDGTVEFKAQADARYFIVGYVDGTYLEVRARGRDNSDDDAVNSQNPQIYDRVRLSDGSWADESPEQHQPTPAREVGPGPGQHQVAKGVVQRSDTPRGSAHPVDPNERAPYRAQEDVPEGTVQMSDTPGFETEHGVKVSGGAATEIVQSVQRQEDTPGGLLQRSDTPHGQATPIPAGDAVQAQLDKESAAAKESRGEPGRAAAEPLGKTQKVGSSKVTGGGSTVPGAANDRDNVSGHDAMGQPIYADVAANLGIEPAKKVLGDNDLSKAPDAKPGEDLLASLDDPPQDLDSTETEKATTGAGEAKPTGDHKVTKLTKGSASRAKSTKAKE